MSKIFDAFLFFNEIDLLNIRMNILKNYVDYFVVTESTMTFSGKPKPLYFKENIHLFKEFESRILYNLVEDTPITNISWEREIHQRNAMKRVLDQICNSDDIVLTGDVDEIPNLEKLMPYYEPEVLIHPLMDMYYYYLNSFREERWFGTKVCDWEFMKNIQIDDLRNMKKIGYAIDRCGWHFSYLGGAEKILQKMDAFSDIDLNNPFIRNHVAENVNNNKDIFFRGQTMKIVPVDDSFPIYIQENQDKLRHLIKEII